MSKRVKVCIFNKNATKDVIILSNGDAILDNICTYCKTYENIDGTYEVDAEFVIDENGLWEHIQEESILKVRMDYGYEFFRLTKPRKTPKRISVYGRQVTIYESMHLWLSDVRPTELNGTAAINWLLDKSLGIKELEVYSNISNVNTAYYEDMNMYEALHDCEQSFQNRWGGEIQRRGYLLSILSRVGNDKGVQIRSRKNLIGFESNTNIDSVVTRIRPKGNNGIVGNFVDSKLINKYARVYTKIFEYDVKIKDSDSEDTEGFDTLEDAQAELTRLANLEFTENHIDVISADYDINFIDLSKTEEYKNYIQTERVYIGDTVHVFEEKLKINVDVRVIDRTYNVLTQKVEEIKLSNKDISSKKKINDVMVDIVKGVEQNDNSLKKWIQSFINNGIKDSYVFYSKEELVVCDNERIEDAVHVWRFNRNGLAHSSTGYNGPYNIAITTDGKINASMILAGMLKGEYIDAKNITVTDGNGNTTFKVDTNGNVELLGKIKAESGEISSDMIVEELNVEGNVSSDKVTTREVNCPDVAKIVTSDATIEVNSNTGNDLTRFENGAIFSTLQGCIESIPKSLNGNTLTINVTSTLNENIVLKGFNAGTLIINFNKDIQGTIKGLDCSAKIFLIGNGENKSTLKYNYKTTGSLNMRTGRDSSYDLVTTILADSYLLVTDIGEENWGYTTWNGYSGYISLNTSYTTKEEIYENTIENTTNIKPALLLSEIGRKYSMFFDNCNYVEINHANVYGKTGSGSFAVGGYRTSNVRVENINIIGSENAFDAVNMSKMFVKNALGKVNSMAYYSNFGSIINIANGLSVNGTFINQDDSQIIYNSEKVILDTSSEVGSNDNSTIANETITLKSISANTYKHNVYKGWTNDNTAKQGDYGYGDCDGYWFFGTQFEKLKGKTIKKITLKITRQKGGIYGSHSHILRAHTYTSKPSSAPTMYGSWSQSFNADIGETATVTITDSTILSAISNGTVKGFGVKDFYDKAHYSVLSANVTLTVITG